MSRFNLDLSIQGNASAQLNDLANGMSRVNALAKSLGDSTGQLVGGVQAGVAALGVQALGTIQGQLDGLRNKLLDTFNSIRDMAAGYGKAIIDDASKFETSQKDLQFAFGAGWEKVYDQVLKDSAELSFTFEETMGLASGLGRMKINPFGGDAPEHQLFMARTGEKVRALSVLQDAASASGRDMGGFMFAIREAISGDMKSITDALDLPKTVTKGWKTEIEKLKEPQEKYNYLVKQLAELFGGASALKAQTFATAMRQLPDLMQQLRAGVGAQGLQTLTGSLWNLIKAFSDFAKDKEVIASLGSAFNTFAQAAALVVNVGAKLLVWMKELIVAAPWLPKIASYALLIGGGLAVMGAMAAGAAISVAALAASILAIGWEAMAVGLGAVVLLFPIFVAMTPVVAGFVLMLTAGAKGVGEGWGGIGSTFDKLKITFTALMELFNSYNGTTATMSLETADKLKQNGMFEFVMKVMDVFHKLDLAWGEFTQTLDEAYALIAPTFIPMIHELGSMFTELADALGLSTMAQAASLGTSDSYISTGHELALMLTGVAKALITGIRFLTEFARVGIAVFHVLTSPVETFERIIDNAVAALFKLKNAARDTLNNLPGNIGTKIFGEKGDAPTARHAPLMAGDLKEKDFNPTGDQLAGGRKGVYGGLTGADANDKIAKDLGLPAKDGGYSTEELSGMLSPDERARLQRGQALRKREEVGMMSLDSAYGLTAGVGSLGDLNKDEKGLADKGYANTKDFGEKRNQFVAEKAVEEQRETNRQLSRLIGVMQSMDTSVVIDGKAVAKAKRNANASVAGDE